jgi:hypothetical protein
MEMQTYNDRNSNNESFKKILIFKLNYQKVNCKFFLSCVIVALKENILRKRIEF